MHAAEQNRHSGNVPLKNNISILPKPAVPSASRPEDLGRVSAHVVRSLAAYKWRRQAPQSVSHRPVARCLKAEFLLSSAQGGGQLPRYSAASCMLRMLPLAGQTAVAWTPCSLDLWARIRQSGGFQLPFRPSRGDL